MLLFDATVTSPVRHWSHALVPSADEASVFRKEVLEWAYLSPDIHNALAADILLYEMALSVFKNQTSTLLGTVWN